MNEPLDHAEVGAAYVDALERANEVMLGDFAANPDYWIGRMHGLILEHGNAVPTGDLLDVFIPLADAMSGQKAADVPASTQIQYVPWTSPQITYTGDTLTNPA